MKYFALLLLLLVNSPLRADYPLEIIELKGRQVEEIIPIIQPFVAGDGSIAGMNNQLIIRTSPENLSEIRRILDQIDRPPRRLLISVRQGVNRANDAAGVAADVNAGVGENSSISIGQPVPDNSARIRGLQASTRSDLDLTHRIQALEGSPAFIATGQAIPVTDQLYYGGGPYPYYQRSINYRNSTSGFFAVARLNGDQVTIGIMPRMERPASSPGSFDVQQAETLVSGRLGEWIPIGGGSREGGLRSGGLNHRATTANRQDRAILLKVEEIR